MSRRAEMAVWAWIGLLAVATAAATWWLAGVEVDFGSREPWPFLVVAALMFGAQSTRINIATAGGRHVVVLTDVVVAVGLLNQRPATLVLAALLGGTPALLLVRTSPIKHAVNLAQTGLWFALPAVAFHLALQAWVPLSLRELSPIVAWLAFAATSAAFVGATLAIRVPIGLTTGAWGVEPFEREQLGNSAVIALGASALAVVGVLLADLSSFLVALLILPVLQIFLSIRSQASSVEQRAALEFTVEAAQQLRLAEDVPGALRQMLPGMRHAFGTERAALLLELPGSAMRLTAGADGVTEAFGAETAVRTWLEDRRSTSPTTQRRDEALVAIGDELGANELLIAPMSVRAAAGAFVLAGRPVGPFRDDHVELARTFTAAASSALHRHLIAQELDEAEIREAELERRVSRDALTGLLTRSAFERELVAALVAGEPTGVAYLDLDGFKTVNDTLGHAAGDRILVEAARRMRGSIGARGMVARLGGDEFGIMLHTQNARAAALTVEDVLSSLSRPLTDIEGVDGIRAAIGVAVALPGEDAASVVSRADGAMYEAKRAGGHRHVLAR